MDPGQSRTFTSRRTALKSEVTEIAPRRIAIINQLPPVLYINNAEGNVWAGKSVFVPAPEMAALNKLLDEEVMHQLHAVFPDAELLRMTKSDARMMEDQDWIIEMKPNGFVVPDFSWGEFAKLVLVGSAQMAAGSPNPLPVQNTTGDPATAAGGANRPAYTMGTHAMYGTFVSVQIAWTVYRGGTWQKLAGVNGVSSVRLSMPKMRKEWSEWTPEEQAVVWRDLQSKVPTIIASQLESMGIKPRL